MKVDRKAIEKAFEQALARYASEQDNVQRITMECYKRYNIPFFRSNTLLKMEASSAEAKDVEIFWLMDCINGLFDADLDLRSWFTDIEIENYANMKYDQGEAVVFPIVLPMIAIEDGPGEQWIGAIKASTLIKWRSSILRYNTNIQRRLNTIVRNGKTYERISVNIKSVKQMVSLFLGRKFVPDTITINMDDTAEYYYDEEAKQLVIESAEYLDLTDGYHRLISLSKAIEEDPSFEYTMELRVTHFSEAMADHFIWQEEQRTIMPKKAIKSYNMDDVSNKIVKRINEDSGCNLSGNIIRGGLCDFSTFADMLSTGLINKMGEKEQKQAIITVPPDFIRSINAITEGNPDIITDKLTVAQVRILAYCCVSFYKRDKDGVFALFDRLMKYPYSEKEKRTLGGGLDTTAMKLLKNKQEEGCMDNGPKA